MMSRQQILTMVFGYLLLFIGLVVGVMYLTDTTTGIELLLTFSVFIILLMLWINATRILKAILALFFRDKMGTRKSKPDAKLGRRD